MAEVDKQKIQKKESPCKSPQPCLDQRDYDPCESGEDITETDLAMLLKEEQDRLRQEKEKAEAEERQQRGKEAGEGGKDEEGKEGNGQKGWNAEGKGWNAEGKERNGEAAGRKKPCRRGKKPPCRRLPETNPFFTDRLGFSNDLPPPPPVPPPQFFPPVDGSEAKICPKRRKKCKKGGRRKDKEGDEGGTGAGTGAVSQSSEKSVADGGIEDGQEDEEECKCLYEDECKEEGMDVWERKRVKGRCKKRARDRPPCRKKVSEVSISLQPRHIPALQRDLPPTCPKDIPEVVRQILMACGKECSVDCGKKKCRKADRCK